MRGSSSNATGVMVDTHVLIYACHHNIAPSATGSLLKRIQEKQAQIPDNLEASAYVFRAHRVVYISAITMLEFARACDPLEMMWVNGLGKRLVPLPVDRRVADAAARLFREFQRISPQKICQVCLNSRDAHPCKLCKKHISAPNKVADSLIAATAQVSTKVGVLYTYDGGILNGFAPRLKDCVAKKPPVPPPPPPPMVIPSQAQKAVQGELPFANASAGPAPNGAQGGNAPSAPNESSGPKSTPPPSDQVPF